MFLFSASLQIKDMFILYLNRKKVKKTVNAVTLLSKTNQAEFHKNMGILLIEDKQTNNNRINDACFANKDNNK